MDFPIDIPVPDKLKTRLTKPECDKLRLPTPKTANLCSPFGGAKFQSICDATKGIPDDCAVTFSLLLQLPPFMVSLGCFIKLLKVMGPLMKFVKAVPDVPTDPSGVISAIGELVPALEDVVNCFFSLQAGVPAFVGDLLRLIARLLECLGGQLKSIATLMSGLDLSIKTAQASGNAALLEQLQCAKDNAAAQAQAAMGSVDLITMLLTMAQPLIALDPNAPNITIPSFGTPQQVDELEQVAELMLTVGASLEQIAKAIPTCP